MSDQEVARYLFIKECGRILSTDNLRNCSVFKTAYNIINQKPISELALQRLLSFIYIPDDYKNLIYLSYFSI